MFGYNIGFKEVIAYLISFYLALDIMILIYNIAANTGTPGKCATKDWISGGLILNSSVKPDDCVTGSSETGILSIGKWSKYATKGEDGTKHSCLYEPQIDSVVKDIRDDHTLQGYTAVQLLAYVIVPSVTVLSVLLWLISTRANKAEWTFWILICTIIYTGLTSVVRETSGIDIGSPSQTSCLSHITERLDFQTGDELKYSFIARKQDGGNCFIEGSYIGTPDGGVASPDQPGTYTGDIGSCSAEALPLY